jgi:hypothetical protein
MPELHQARRHRVAANPDRVVALLPVLPGKLGRGRLVRGHHHADDERSGHTMIDNHRFITTIERGNADTLLIALPLQGRRAITKTLRRDVDESPQAFLKRAVEWRDRAWRRLFGGPVPARSFHVNARATSATGVPGVRVINKTVRKGAHVYVIPCVIAEVHTLPGKDYRRPSGSRSRIYSLNRYDLDEAVALAAAWRDAQLSELLR